MIMEIDRLPKGFFILDGDHDGDMEDGRYGLYQGSSYEDCFFHGNTHDLEQLILLAIKYHQLGYL